MIQPEEVVAYMAENKDKDPTAVCQELNMMAMNKKSRDNITVVLVKFHQ